MLRAQLHQVFKNFLQCKMKIAVPGAYTNRFSADPNPVCGCGGIQCVETRASLTGLTRRITWTLNESGAALIRGELAERGEEINPDVIAILQQLCQESPQRAAYEVRTFADAEKDSFCRWLLEDWAIMIGALFASLAPAFHPDLFIIGGGMAFRQLDYLQNKALGFDREHLVVGPLADGVLRQRYAVWKRILLQNPDFVRITGASSKPGEQTGVAAL